MLTLSISRISLRLDAVSLLIALALRLDHILPWSSTRQWVVGTRGFQGSLPCRSTESLVCWYLASEDSIE